MLAVNQYLLFKRRYPSDSSYAAWMFSITIAVGGFQAFVVNWKLPLFQHKQFKIIFFLSRVQGLTCLLCCGWTRGCDWYSGWWSPYWNVRWSGWWCSNGGNTSGVIRCNTRETQGNWTQEAKVVESATASHQTRVWKRNYFAVIVVTFFYFVKGVVTQCSLIIYHL